MTSQGPTCACCGKPLADGYRQAIATLRGVAERTGSPAAQWAADYLTADPDRLGPPATEASR